MTGRPTICTRRLSLLGLAAPSFATPALAHEFRHKIRKLNFSPPGNPVNGSITTSHAGTVTYQCVSHDGRNSPQLQLPYDGAGSPVMHP